MSYPKKENWSTAFYIVCLYFWHMLCWQIETLAESIWYSVCLCIRASAPNLASISSNCIEPKIGSVHVNGIYIMRKVKRAKKYQTLVSILEKTGKSLGSLVQRLTSWLGHCLPTPDIYIVTRVTGSLVHSFTASPHQTHAVSLGSLRSLVHWFTGSLGHWIPTPGIHTRVTGSLVHSFTRSLVHMFTKSLHLHTRHTH